ncbi:MAG: ABC transporter permease [Bryobacteraceae bacterium]|nr:ABC transporter permease [Bryobacteraceae bacterium]
MAEVPRWRRYERLSGPDPQADVDDELRFHVESKTDALIAQGWKPEAARAEAERQFGDLRKLRQDGVTLGRRREERKRRREYWDEFAQDLRYAVRMLRRDRGFAFISAFILALGIAANTAVFSVVNTLLLRPLPFPNAQELTWLASGRDASAESRRAAGLSAVTYTVDAFEEIQRHNRSFQSLTSYNPFFGNSEYTLTGSGEPQPVAGVMVAENFFQTLGVEPVLGRLFAAEECQRGGRAAAVLSHGFWQRQFGGDPAIVGRAIILSKTPVTVVGVLPAAFDFGAVFAPGVGFEIFVPAVMDELRSWGNTLAVIGRLKPGVSAARAQAELDVLMPQLKAAHKEWWGDYASTVTGLKDFVSGRLRRSLIALWCAVGVVLLIVCVNLSNLMLSRAAARNKEFAMRAALGAGRARLLRQLVTESLVLSGAGAMGGLALAFAVTAWLGRQGSIALPLLSSVSVDRAALAWTLLIAVGTALLFGIAPGLSLTASNIHSAIKSGGPGMSTGRGHERLRAWMVVSEVSLACVLLIAAGLLLRSFLNVLAVDLGFQPDRAAAIRIDYEARDGEQRRAVLEEILRNVRAIPGIEAAGVADMLPLGRNRSWGLRASGREYRDINEAAALVRIVTPGYLGAMGMRLKQGRDFSWRDASRKEPVVIVNEAAARRHWPGRDPVGQLALTTGSGGWQETRIVGVIDDARQHSLEASAGPEMYLPVWQASPEGAELVIRSKLPPEALASSVMRTLRALNPAQPATQLRPLGHIVEQSVSPRRFFALLVTVFAALGLLLAALGIYGVISYSVARQTQEIGIRMALGAGRPQVQRHVIGRGLRLALAGVVLGTVASLGATRWIAAMLFDATPMDPATFAGVALLFMLVALAAGYVPARRASRIEPIVALRNQ